MNFKRNLSIILGLAQGVLGFVFLFLVLVLLFEIIEVQTVFNLPSELLPGYLLILFLFSFFSLISGLFLIREGRKK